MVTPITGASQDGSPQKSLIGNTGVGDTGLMAEARLEKSEGEGLGNNVIQETGEVTVRASCGSTEGREWTQAIFDGPGGPKEGGRCDFVWKRSPAK